MLTATQSRAVCKLAVLLLLPIVLYIVPTDGIFNGESICLFKRFLNTECWGCGMTRAFFSLMYGRIGQAWEYNPLITVVFPLLLWIWCKEVWQTFKKTRLS